MTKVLFKRKSTNDIATLPVEDGSLIYDYQTGATYLDYDNERIATGGGAPTGDTYPIGAIAPYGGNTAPANWLICDGSAISRVTYADLFSVIGTSFGSGDGSTTFNLPDLRSKVPLGKDSRDTDFDTIGETIGNKNHNHAGGDLIACYNPYNAYGNITVRTKQVTTDWDVEKYANESKEYISGGGGSNIGTAVIGNTSNSNSLQPSLVTNYIIKAFQSSGVVANVANTKSTSNTDTYSCNYINSFDKYSTSETKTSKVWIDNKPIYRKVATGTIQAGGGTYPHVATGITNIDKVTNTHLIVNYGENNQYYGSSLVYYLDKNSDNDIIFISPDRTGNVYIVVEYTKTTD